MRNLRDNVYLDIEQTEADNEAFSKQVKSDRVWNSVIFNSLFFGSWVILIGLAFIGG